LGTFRGPGASRQKYQLALQRRSQELLAAYRVAWDISGKGTTVIRAGGSIVYDLLSMSTYMSQQNLQSAVALFGAGVVPTGAQIFDNGACAAGCPGIGNITAAGVIIPGSVL